MPHSVVVSIQSIWEMDDGSGVTVETSMLGAIPPARQQSLTEIRLIEVGNPDIATFTYSRTRESRTATWSGHIDGLIELEVLSDRVLIETVQGWTEPRGRCLAVIGSAALSYDGANKPEWLRGNVFMAWPSIGLIADGRVVPSNYSGRCLPFATPMHLGGLASEGATTLLPSFFVPHESKIEGIVVDPWGDETAGYEAVFLDSTLTR